MPLFTRRQDRLIVTVNTPEIELSFSLEDGGLRSLRRIGGPNVIGYGNPRPSIDVRLDDRDWLADHAFVRYLSHTIDEREGAVELVILIGIGPLRMYDRYRITGTLIARRITVENVGEDERRLCGVRLVLPWARVGTLDGCRFDSPGNSVRPRVPFQVAAAQRYGVLPRRFFAPGLREERAMEPAPTRGAGLMALHNPETDEGLLCWYHSMVEEALPQVEGNGTAVTLIHQIELADWLRTEVALSGGTQYILLLREPWSAALDAFRRTMALYGPHTANHSGWVQDAAIYECHPAQFGGFRGLTAALPELRELGLNTLCLMPIWEFANLKGRLWDGNWEASGDPYAVRDFEALDPALGTIEDLRTLVDAAHSSGLRVLLDLPLAGSADNSRYLAEHPDWFCYDQDGRLARVPGQPAMVAFDWASQDLQEYLLGWAIAQLHAYDIDGYRVATPRVGQPNWVRRGAPHASAGDMGSLRLIERLQREIKRAKSDAALLAGLCGPAYVSCSDFAIDELPHHMFVHLALSRVTPVELGEWLEDHWRALPSGAVRVCFTESHLTRIINPLADGLRGSRISRMLLAGMVLSGFVPMIWFGQERSEYSFVAQLLRMREQQPALRYGAVLYNAVPCDSAQVFTVLRVFEGQQIVGLLNVGPHKQTIAVSLPVDTLGLPDGDYVLYDLFARAPWVEEGRHTWRRDELLSMRLTVAPFGAYCFAVQAADRYAPAEDTPPALETGLPPINGAVETIAVGEEAAPAAVAAVGESFSGRGRRQRKANQ
jgi:starch synthase (maltosyl-transferring)